MWKCSWDKQLKTKIKTFAISRTVTPTKEDYNVTFREDREDRLDLQDGIFPHMKCLSKQNQSKKITQNTQV